MFHVEEQIVVDRPAGVVWPYLIAFEQVPLWEQDVVEVRIPGGEASLGSEVVARRRYGPRVSEVRGEITDWQPGRSATMRLRGGPLAHGDATYAVDPIDEGHSRVTYTTDAALVGALRLMHPLAAGAGARIARTNLAALKRRVESGIDPRSNLRP